jgi:hypothetical protein
MTSVASFVSVCRHLRRGHERVTAPSNFDSGFSEKGFAAIMDPSGLRDAPARTAA